MAALPAADAASKLGELAALWGIRADADPEPRVNVVRCNEFDYEGLLAEAERLADAIVPDVYNTTRRDLMNFYVKPLREDAALADLERARVD